MGDGTTTKTWRPKLVRLPLPVTRVALGGDEHYDWQTLALLSNGKLWAWGADESGQLGDGSSGYITSPERSRRLFPMCRSSPEGRTSFGVDATGKLWGSIRDDELGNGTTVSEPTPSVILSGVTALSGAAITEEALVQG